MGVPCVQVLLLSFALLVIPNISPFGTGITNPLSSEGGVRGGWLVGLVFSCRVALLSVLKGIPDKDGVGPENISDVQIFPDSRLSFGLNRNLFWYKIKIQ